MRAVPGLPRQRHRTHADAAPDARPDGAPEAGPDAFVAHHAAPVGSPDDSGPPADDDRTGPARVDLRGSRLPGRLTPGDIAVVDRLDIDLVTATALIARRPAAVVNVTSSATGRSPALGAAALVASGVRLVDDAGPRLLAALDDGDTLTVARDGRILRGSTVLTTGTPHDERSVARAMQAGRAALRAHVAAIGAAAPGVVDADVDTVLPPGEHPVPDLAVLLSSAGGRAARRARLSRRAPVLVVGGGPRAPRDLDRLRRRLPRRSLVVATVDGAGPLLDRGRRPDVVIGDARRAAERVLAARPAVVHLASHAAAPADLAEARERLDRSGVASQLWRTGLPADGAAVVLALCAQAPLTVVAGGPRGLLEALDREPAAAAAALLVGAAHGHRMVDADAVVTLIRPPLPWALAALPVAVGILGLTVAFGVLGGWSPADGWVPGPAPAAAEEVADRAGDLWARLASLGGSVDEASAGGSAPGRR